MQPDPEEHGVLAERPGSSGHPGLCSAGRPHQRECLPGQPEETLPREPHIRESASSSADSETLVLLRRQLAALLACRSPSAINQPENYRFAGHDFLSFPLQTYIGTLLVSVNPYKELDIYSKKQMDTYMGVNFFELPPHM